MSSYPTYGHPVWPAPMQPQYHGMRPDGFCHSCCHPVSQCCCGHRECRREAKELLNTGRDSVDKLIVSEPADVAADGERVAEDININREEDVLKRVQEMMGSVSGAATTVLSQSTLTELVRQSKAGYIGGGCCVHLSIECTAGQKGTFVTAAVLDSENTLLVWGKAFTEPGYYIKENIISTNPGAKVWLAVTNGIARLRWCEVFSC